jgi:hypothetical protein
MTDDPKPVFSVHVFDMAHHGEDDGDWLVEGFDTLAAARAYAEARMRASVEELRKPGISAEELRSLWFSFGEDCVVVEDKLEPPAGGVAALDRYIAEPASPGQCDWPSLAPRLKRFYAAVLVSDGAGRSVWAGGFLKRHTRPSRQDLLDTYRDDACAAFARRGIAETVPAEVHVASLFELPDPPRPPPDCRPLRNWKVAVEFVCHDVKYGGRSEGVFAWPEKPCGEALSAMIYLLMADEMARRGDGPDWAKYCDVNQVDVGETDEPAHFPI